MPVDKEGDIYMLDKDGERVYPARPIEEMTACPAHPGEVLKGLYLDELPITISEFARRIGVSRKALSMIVNGRKSITPEMALRLSRALNTRAEFWLDMQSFYDTWQVTHAKPGLMEQLQRIAAVI